MCNQIELPSLRPRSLSRVVSCLCPTYLYSGQRSYGRVVVAPVLALPLAESGLCTPLGLGFPSPLLYLYYTTSLWICQAFLVTFLKKIKK